MLDPHPNADRLRQIATMLGRPAEGLFAGDLAQARSARFGELFRLWEMIDSEAGLDAVLARARETVAAQTPADQTRADRAAE